MTIEMQLLSVGEEIMKRQSKEIAALHKRIADATSPEGVERAWKAYCTNGSCSPSVSTLAAIRAALGDEVTG